MTRPIRKIKGICVGCGDSVEERQRGGTRCVPCQRVKRAEWRRANADRVRAYKAQVASDPEYRRRKFLWKHALTPADFDRLFEAQGHACALCRATDHGGRGWHIDHDHACCPDTGKRRCGKCYRGILCHRCNVGLGMFGDSPPRLLAAIDYLRASVRSGSAPLF